MTRSQPLSCALVLGSGGARGLAHIGVINWLVEHDVKITAISGSSIGALIGALHAVGKLDQYRDWMTSLSRWDIIRLLELTLFARASFMKADKVFERLRDLLGDIRIEQLPIDFTAVATDINAGQEVWFQQGELFAAVRASVAIPSILSPVTHQGRLLVDGGLLNPVPMAPVFSSNADITIAVDLSGPKQESPLAAYESTPQKQSDPAITDKIFKFFEREHKPKPDAAQLPSMIDLTARSIDIMQAAISRSKLAAYPPDHQVILPRNSCELLDFERCDALVQLGYHQAEAQLQHLKPGAPRHAQAPKI